MKYFFSVDWGTSSLRVRLAGIENGAISILYERSDHNGIAYVHELSGKEKDQILREEYFLDFLAPYLVIPGSVPEGAAAPVVISGMATSSIGLREVPYAALPFALDGSDLTYEIIPGTDRFRHNVLLLSGLCSSNDVMRGEEVQLLGLHTYHKTVEEAIFILPGTHSKHIRVRNNEIVSFKTYMTGEMFKLLCTYSVLKNSIASSPVVDREAFRSGLKLSKGNILNSAFTIRAASLLHKTENTANHSLLSGLLIGAELNDLADLNVPVYLCAHGNLSSSYALAIEELDLQERCRVIPSELVDEAVVYGQMLGLERVWKVNEDL